jgi:hypothetical protein
MGLLLACGASGPGPSDGVSDDGAGDEDPAAPADATPAWPEGWPFEPFPEAVADAPANDAEPPPPSPWREIGWDAVTDWTGVGGERFDDLLVVGRGGRALRFDGRQFLPIDTGTDADLRSADARDGRGAIVGDKGVCLVSAGGPFSPLALGTAADLYGVRLLPTGDLYAVGDQGTIRRWTGEQVLSEGSNTLNRLTSVWGPSPDELTITGSAGGVLEKIAGSWFRSQVATGSITLNDLGGVVDGPRVAVGDQGTLRRHDGLGWLDELSNDLDAHALRGVTVPALNDAWAAGDAGTLLRFKRDDGGKGAWNKVPLAGPVFASADLFDIYAEEIDEVVHGVAVGAGGALLVERGEGWRDASPVPTTTLAAAATLSDGSLAAVGAEGVVVKVTASRLVGLPTGLPEAITAVQARPAGVLRLGLAGRLVDYAPDTGATASLPLGATDAVVRAFEGDLACGDLGLLLRIEAGGSAVPLASGTVRDLLAAAPGDEGEVWVAGRAGTLLRVRGTEVLAIDLPVTDDLHALAVAADGTLLAAGDHGLVVERASDTGELSFTRLDATSFWYAAAWHPLAGWWLGGFAGAVAHRSNGTDWQRVDLPLAVTVAALLFEEGGGPVAFTSPANAYRWSDALP